MSQIVLSFPSDQSSYCQYIWFWPHRSDAVTHHGVLATTVSFSSLLGAAICCQYPHEHVPTYGGSVRKENKWSLATVVHSLRKVVHSPRIWTPDSATPQMRPTPHKAPGNIPVVDQWVFFDINQVRDRIFPIPCWPMSIELSRQIFKLVRRDREFWLSRWL